LSAVEGRPCSRRPLLRLKRLQKRRDRIDGRDLHPSHPLPLVSARRFAGAGEREGKEVLSAGCVLSAQNADAQGEYICSGFLEKT
jgi:hypothetical protein